MRTRAAALLLGAVLARGAPAQDVDWARAYRTDLAWAHATLRDNHPGAVDPESPRFRDWLERGHAQASAARVRDKAGYVYALQRYVVGFGDTHTTLVLDFTGIPARWAGVVVQGREDGGAIVVDREPDDTAAPPLGARVVSCDGAPFDSLVARELAFQGHPRSHARRRWATTWALVDGSNPLRPPPAACVFEHEGRRARHALRWRPFAATTLDRLMRAVRLEPATLGLSEVAPGVFWVGIPSFAAGPAVLRPLVDSIAARATALRSARAVILDVRGNGGGSSVWGQEIVAALWGKDAADPNLGGPAAVDWRASPANADFVASARAAMTRPGTNPAVLDLLRRVEAGMREAIAEGRPYWRQEGRAGPSGGLTRRRPVGPGAIAARVALLTDDGCASACLDFADRVLAQPGTTHLGMVTNGDNLYIDKRDPLTSPSGHARLDHSLKVYRGRPRGDMEAYEPDLPYCGEWTTAALRAWALDLVERGALGGAAGRALSGARTGCPAPAPRPPRSR